MRVCWRNSSSATCVSQKRERLRRKNVSLYERGNTWHFAFRWNGNRYRGSCKTSEGSSAANTNNALRTLRRMLKKAHEWQLLSVVPIVKLVEEHGREEFIEPWMEQQLLIVTGGPRLTPKSKKSRVGWEPFRTILLTMLDSGLRPGEIFRMRWENIHWDKGVIFNPRGKSRKSRRYVPLTERVKAALLARKGGANDGWVFRSKKSQSGYITDHEVSGGWKPNGWQVFPKRLSCTVLAIVSQPMQ